MRRPGRRAAGVVLGVAAAVVLLGACSSSSASSAPPATRPATTARLRILAPRPGAVVGAQPTLRLQLTGARLANAAAAGGNVPADQGFVHVYVDDKLVSVLYSLSQKLPTLDPGPHTVRVELVAVDHAPFANQVTDTSRFRVKA
jgi:predicted component of type VI protein secretion system